MVYILSISTEITLRMLPQDFISSDATVVHVMVCCCQAMNPLPELTKFYVAISSLRANYLTQGTTENQICSLSLRENINHNKEWANRNDRPHCLTDLLKNDVVFRNNSALFISVHLTITIADVITWMHDDVIK